MIDSSMLFGYGPPPPPPLLHPPDIIHMIGVPPRPSPFFAALPRIIQNANLTTTTATKKRQG